MEYYRAMKRKSPLRPVASQMNRTVDAQRSQKNPERNSSCAIIPFTPNLQKVQEQGLTPGEGTPKHGLLRAGARLTARKRPQGTFQGPENVLCLVWVRRVQQSLRLSPALLSVNETSVHRIKDKEPRAPALSSSEDHREALLGVCIGKGWVW